MAFTIQFTLFYYRWDAQYFLHIADNGYTYENTFAFFPIYPISVRAFAEVIYWLQVDYSLIHFTSALKLSAILVNIGAFVLSAVMLHELSRKGKKHTMLGKTAPGEGGVVKKNKQKWENFGSYEIFFIR